jgi:hypothetical protein
MTPSKVYTDSDQATKAYYATAARNILIYDDLVRALRVLNDAGVPVIVLKGAALAETIYPNIAHRPMGDADLLVRPGDRDHARAAFEAAGYRFLPEPEERFKPFDTCFTSEMAFRRGEGVDALIELHWELISAEWYRRTTALKVEALWERARPLRLEGAAAWQLSPEDTLIHLCVHLAAHAFHHPPAYNDIDHLLRAEAPFPWDRFLERVADFRVRTPVYFALSAARKLEGAPVLDGILIRLKPSFFRRKLVEAIANPERVAAGEIPFSRPRSYLLHLALADRPRDALSALIWLLFPGPHWLAQRYRLQGHLMPLLYTLFHPLFVMWQGFLGVRDLVIGRILPHRRPP